jgi:UDP-glucose 4-epimerase
MILTPPDLKSLSKKFNEETAHLYSERYGIKAIGLRPYNVYGDEEFSKGPFANTVSLFVWAMLSGNNPIIWGNGEQTRDFIYVDDVVKSIILALEKDLKTQEFNVGTGEETSINQLISLLNSKIETDLKAIHKPVPVDIYASRLVADPTRAEKILGFKSTITLEDGVERVIQRAKSIIREMPELGEYQTFIINETKKKPLV